MYLGTYDEVLEKTVVIDLQARFCDELERLQTLGFHEDYYLRETLFPFSAIALLPAVIYAHRKGERIRIGGLLEFMIFNPCMIHEKGYAYAIITKLGVRYTSVFDNGKLFSTTISERDSLQHALSSQIKRTWKRHVKSVKDLTRKGPEVIKPIGIEDVMRMEKYLPMGRLPDVLKEKRKNG